MLFDGRMSKAACLLEVKCFQLWIATEVEEWVRFQECMLVVIGGSNSRPVCKSGARRALRELAVQVECHDFAEKLRGTDRPRSIRSPPDTAPAPPRGVYDL
jgi:hypothetical protein